MRIIIIIYTIIQIVSTYMIISISSEAFDLLMEITRYNLTIGFVTIFVSLSVFIIKIIAICIFIGVFSMSFARVKRIRGKKIK